MRLLGSIAVVLALFSATVTFAVLAGLTPVAPTHQVVVSVLLVDAVAALLLIGVIGREIWNIMQARRHGRAGARLHVRIIGLFSVVAAVPAILVAIVASITLDRGLAPWFTSRIQSVIQNSLTVSQIYFNEQSATIRSEVSAMAFDVSRAKTLFDSDRARFREFLKAQAQVRGLPLTLIVHNDLTVIEKAEIEGVGDIAPPPASGALSAVGETEPQVAMFLESKTVAAVIKLRGYDDTYLYVARPLDPRVIEQFQATQESVAEFANLEQRRVGVQVAFALMYTVIALIVLLSAVWIGLNFANRLVAPIRRLIGAANLVSTGNLYVQVPVRRGEGDLSQLGETFNKMTQELRTQRDDLMRARDVIDRRRRFTEAVLAGASAGVIGVDSEGRISILNRSAEKLIGQQESDAVGRDLVAVMPELAPLFTEAHSGMHRLVQGQITISRDMRERNLSVRVTTEQSADEDHGYVVTLDDITDLVTAQRTSAWADIARRIAHEIKNPLTPIQLSAERLKRKYSKVITEDKAVFEQCTDTIVRQVDDIKRMVDEFSRFARMPKPVMTAEDVADTARQVVFLQRVGNPDIDIEITTEQEHMPAKFDRRLISQGLTNIVKNATEAIAAVPPEQLGRGRIHVSVKREGGDIVIDVIDNGTGLPKENRNRLLEPYVTTREKGTGLGLAIVGRILEEHNGQMELSDAPDVASGGRGAWVRLRFAAESVTSAAPRPAAPAEVLETAGK
ncbi:MAG: two-component system, NtrC family, nitrogen regulation sensor histidine kinase NtrY [Hyphomicrobiales bacterium]|nr:two-component system, NtrC family, nitrogen regulation sensor histidine kinase NtrY [Hyphomicrobiales bacterium]